MREKIQTCRRWLNQLPLWQNKWLLIISVIVLALIPLSVVATLTYTNTRSRAAGLYLATPPFPPTNTPIPVLGFAKAVVLNGIDSYLFTAKDDTISKNFTVELWVKPELKRDSTRPQGITISQTTPYKQLDWDLSTYEYPGSSSLELRFALATPGPATRNWFLPNILSPNNWYHLAVTAVDGKLRVFINGNNVLTDSYTPFSPGAVSGPVGLVIGGTDFVTGEIEIKSLFKGAVDELRVSAGGRYTNNFLPPSEPFITDNQTVYLFHFDGNAQDASGKNNHGQIVGNVQFVDSTIPVPTPSATNTPTPAPVTNHPPVIITKSLPAGRLFTSYQAKVSASDEDRDKLKMEALGLPRLLKLGSCSSAPGSITCQVSGRPIQRGTFNVNIKVTDSQGATTKKTLLLVIR